MAVVLNKPLTAKVFDGKDDDNNDSDMSGMRYVAVLAAMSPEEIKAF